ncbi:54S ribosomal protein L25, mitochondrial [Lithohypha guttulata]|uniref:54S ribosomal protein L25, mitochondrial n=1 Tax=Lithohypha guttulata TaxID=1690604 RepID=A0AAN7SVH3_9EURO|nr:54S ribosomal protein L25, mitochondrial [Lithohypha guttulata]
MAAIVAQSPAGKALPERLLNFFARFPPRLYGSHFTNEKIPTLREKIAKEGNKRTGTPPTASKIASRSASKSQTQTSSLQSQQLQVEGSATATAGVDPIESSDALFELPAQVQAETETEARTQPRLLLDPDTNKPIFDPADQPPNPFLPYKNPATGRWRGPTISLRRQAELFKLARVYGVEPLLPASRKSSEFKQTRILERGLAVQGTGEGKHVKGHKWERQMGVTLERRITAMEKMPALIREWRMRGNGRRWKKYPAKTGA